MFTATAHSQPGEPDRDNEDWYIAADGLVIVLDGATIRTDTGCSHSLPWYVHQLGNRLLAAAGDRHRTLTDALARGISEVSADHADTCDLAHPGTPSAAIGVVRVNGGRLEWLVLGDITVMVQTSDELRVTCDNRVSQVAVPQRRTCDQYPLGSPEKMAAIQAMKPLELAARNMPGGYWIASANPAAAEHALSESAPLSEVSRFAACSDGVMRALTMTSPSTHQAVLKMLSHAGPAALIDRVRAAEDRDAEGLRWPRNKRTDDATAVVARMSRLAQQAPDQVSNAESVSIADIARSAKLFGAAPTRDGRFL